MKIDSLAPSENARMMKLVDFSEIVPEPPPPPPKEIEIPVVESIAETMIETDKPPDQIVVAPGAITAPVTPSWDDYLPVHMVSVPPKINAEELYSDIVYPPIALRSGIEGSVIVELFIDRGGHVQQILILQENPKDRGFGDAAIRGFTGKRGTPAYDADGNPVSARLRYPVRFKIK
ncbi:MAG: energy transducer TonB [Treponema sp.]|nr:energy transducer TonB [Treponema sp.]